MLTRAMDRNLSQIRFASSGESIFATVEDSGAVHLIFISLAVPCDPGADSEHHLLIGGDLAVKSYSMSLDGTTTVALVSTPQSPAEVHLVVAGSLSGLRQLTHANDELLGGVTLGAVHKVTVPCTDVRDYTALGNREMRIDRTTDAVEMFVVMPPGAAMSANRGVRYPTILWNHGGPVGQYDYSFSEVAQLFANAGYVVLLVNPRGSTGRGEEFCAALYADWGGPATHDVLTAVDYAVDVLGVADPDRLGVGGWSYGGILANYVITADQRFKAAMSGASQFLFTAAYGHDQYQLLWEAA